VGAQKDALPQIGPEGSDHVCEIENLVAVAPVGEMLKPDPVRGAAQGVAEESEALGVAPGIGVAGAEIGLSDQIVEGSFAAERRHGLRGPLPRNHKEEE